MIRVFKHYALNALLSLFLFLGVFYLSNTEFFPGLIKHLTLSIVIFFAINVIAISLLFYFSNKTQESIGLIAFALIAFKFICYLVFIASYFFINGKNISKTYLKAFLFFYLMYTIAFLYILIKEFKFKNKTSE